MRPESHSALRHDIKHQSGNGQNPERPGNNKRNQGAGELFIFQHVNKEN